MGGIQVWSCYRHGSVRMGLEAFKYAVNIHWTGLSHQDIASLNVPPQTFVPLTDKARKGIAKLISWEGTQDVKMELEEMQKKNYSVELQALHFGGTGFLLKYVVKKILTSPYR
eukprot:TRINITY_DN9193_c0_g1_i2.p4 TRINITY_DN9193_c0_g1~~TRINITY_DN9193_c0_g1_i2.p4  ORF type:complete len:113 (-),score=38.77 TRINITY_DN9193_c0_g1_i2:53-391(-)